MAVFPYHHWHALERDKVAKLLDTSARGLSQEIAESRQQQYGFNVLPEEKTHTIRRIIMRQFSSPLILILIGAGIISIFLNDVVDAGIIFGAVLLNAAIGFFQELKVSNILDELKKAVQYKATVLRDGKQKTIDAQDVTIGDILVLRQGDTIPADARIFSGSNFKTSEAAFSGESSAVEKDFNSVLSVETSVADRINMVFMGTVVDEGIAHAAVVSIGNGTEFGKIIELVAQGEDKTPLEKKLSRLAKMLGFVFLGISVLLFVFGLLEGTDPLEIFLVSVAVAVAAVPESLPIALSATLAVGAKRIFAKGGLIRKMIGAEALGSTTVIAADKTATLTEGKMKLTNIVTGDGTEFESEQFFDIVERNAATAEYTTLELLSIQHNAYIENPSDPSDAWRITGRPIDRAVAFSTASVGLSKETVSERAPRITELPFDSRRRFSAVLNYIRKDSGMSLAGAKDRFVMTVLGAPEVVIERSSKQHTPGDPVTLSEQDKERLLEKVDALAREGFKVLAMGYKGVTPQTKELSEHDAKNVVFLSLVAFSDPVRDEVPDAIALVKQAGIRVIMITGDHVETARYIAQKVGILGPESQRFVEGADLPMNLNAVVNKFDVFARASPENKLGIIKALEENKESVAMIGDGINDAPALVQAGIGVAVGSGTDVAKEAADLILLHDSFAIVVEAIKQGRIILDNIRKTLLFLLGSAFSEVILIAGSIISGSPLALLPAQILWVNIMVDGVPAISLAFEKEEHNVMQQSPSKQRAILPLALKKVIVFFSVITDALLIIMFLIMLKSGATVEYARTMAFFALGLKSLAYIFSVKSLSRPIWRVNPFSNKLLLLGVGVGVSMYLIAFYIAPIQSLLQTVPLGVSDWFLVLAIGLFNIAVIEFAKWKFIRKNASITA